MADGDASTGSFADIFAIIEELRDKLSDNPDLSATQRAQIEALLAYYLAITKELSVQVNNSLTPGDGPQGFSLTPGDGPKKHRKNP